MILLLPFEKRCVRFWISIQFHCYRQPQKKLVQSLVHCCCECKAETKHFDNWSVGWESRPLSPVVCDKMSHKINSIRFDFGLKNEWMMQEQRAQCLQGSQCISARISFRIPHRITLFVSVSFLLFIYLNSLYMASDSSVLGMGNGEISIALKLRI